MLIFANIVIAKVDAFNVIATLSVFVLYNTGGSELVFALLSIGGITELSRPGFSKT